MVMADFARALPFHAPMDWMAVSSYGASTKSSGVVQIRKDLDTDLNGKHVLIVEDIIDSGLTLSWLLENFGSRGAESIEVPGAPAQARGREGRHRLQVRGLRHPHRFRRRITASTTTSVTRNLRDVAVLAAARRTADAGAHATPWVNAQRPP